MQNLESIHLLIEKIAGKEYSLNGMSLIFHKINVKIFAFFSLFIGPELGFIALVLYTHGNEFLLILTY